MIARLFLSLLIPAVPLVAGLQKIRPNLRQLDADAAAMIAEKHNSGVAAVMESVDSGASMQDILDAAIGFMQEDSEIPDFDESAMSTLATTVFVADENGEADFIQGMTDQSEALSESSPVMAAVNEVISNLDSFGSVEECTDKVTEAAEQSGQESEMTLASISDAVAEASGQYWNEADGARRKLQFIPLVAIIIADVLGAIIGFLLGGIIGAILLGLLASILAAFQLGFPIC